MKEMKATIVAVSGATTYALHLGEELLEFDQARQNLDAAESEVARGKHKDTSVQRFKVVANFDMMLNRAVWETFDVLWLAYHINTAMAWELVPVRDSQEAVDTQLVWGDQSTHMIVEIAETQLTVGRELDHSMATSPSSLQRQRRPVPLFLLETVMNEKQKDRLRAALLLLSELNAASDRSKTEHFVNPLDGMYSLWVDNQENRGRSRADYWHHTLTMDIAAAVWRALWPNEEYPGTIKWRNYTHIHSYHRDRKLGKYLKAYKRYQRTARAMTAKPKRKRAAS